MTLFDPKITGVQNSVIRLSENVLMMSSGPIPLISPMLIPTTGLI
jgi:hypothetical protein